MERDRVVLALMSFPGICFSRTGAGSSVSAGRVRRCPPSPNLSVSGCLGKRPCTFNPLRRATTSPVGLRIACTFLPTRNTSRNLAKRGRFSARCNCTGAQFLCATNRARRHKSIPKPRRLRQQVAETQRKECWFIRPPTDDQGTVETKHQLRDLPMSHIVAPPRTAMVKAPCTDTTLHHCLYTASTCC